MDKTNYVKVAHYFYLKEFECPCCKRVMLHPDLLKKLIELRNEIKEELFINSGYRCEIENKKVDGHPRSYHLFGMAADVSVRNMSIIELLYYAEKIKFTGIGVYGTFLHLDTRPNKSRWED
jgi:uncharacterized protein YcbK (DUF882 family)